MIILDTNIVSEMMQKSPDQMVVDWFKHQDNEQIRITALTVAEIKYGISLLPDGRRKKALDAGASRLFGDIFKDKIVPFDSDAAHHYPAVHQSRRALGKSVTVMDAELAAICISNNAILATRNTKDFTGVHVRIVNPFSDKTTQG
ncbi:MAG: type II toxin-antitoxin system VapC family toxin [Coriobacteriales bacterium]|jgi:predicted nucleic acid-binding protein|nr:type II toxin-antitoxin system VapC family toxin [Coriobacteriales bacterium]